MTRLHHLRWTKPVLPLLVATCLLGSVPCFAQAPGWVLDYKIISAEEGGFGGNLSVDDQLGRGLTELGDLDGDGITDIAATCQKDDDGGLDRGAIWILFLNEDGTVKSEQKISQTKGGFGGQLSDEDRMGRAIESIGDLDGDGVIDLAVDASWDDDGGDKAGAIWILFLNSDGTVKAEQKISELEGGLGVDLDARDNFGRSIVHLGDLDGDGVTEIAVGATGDDDGGTLFLGAMYVLFMNTDGTVKATQKISQTEGGFEGEVVDFQQFGYAASHMGDLDLDGVPDMAVNLIFDAEGGPRSGAIFILFLNSDGTVKAHQKISQFNGGFEGELDTLDQFGGAISVIDDLDGDGVQDLAAAALGDDDGGPLRGAVYILFMNRDGTVHRHQKISSTAGGFTGQIRNNNRWPSAFANLGDRNGDGFPDLAVGQRYNDDHGTNKGAIWILNLDGAYSTEEKAQVIALESELNHPDSLVHSTGIPQPGETVVLGLDNPMGTQASGSLPLLRVTTSASPKGTILPGASMAVPGADAELFIAPGGSVIYYNQIGEPWVTRGEPVLFEVEMPPSPNLLGTSFFAQGVILDSSPGAAIPFGLSSAYELLIGF